MLDLGSAGVSTAEPRPRMSAGAKMTAAAAHRRAWTRILGGAAAVAAALIMLAPFLWMVGTSLMDEIEVFGYPPPILPAEPRWANYGEALTSLPFHRFFWVSTVMSVLIVAGHLVTSTTAAYAFARLEFPGRDRLFLLYLATMMVPGIVLLIPRFLLVDAFGWIDRFEGLVVTELVSVWGIFLLRQYFLTIPRELEDAARLDGASEWRIFLTVVLPLSRPAIATLALFSLVASWKEFLWPLVITRSLEMRPVEVAIATFSTFYAINWPYQMAAAVTAILPIVVLFFFAQRYFIQGIQMTGLKG